MSSDVNLVAYSILSDEVLVPADLVSRVTAWPHDQRDDLVTILLPHVNGRRWLRSALLPELSSDFAGALARRLLSFETDFAADRRDSTTVHVVRALPIDELLRFAPFFAGSNAAGPFWSRIAVERPGDVPHLALAVIGSGDEVARETTLYILLLDPHSDIRLTGSDRLAILNQALDDPQEAVRGIAADVLADEAPDQLVAAGETLWLDSSEQVRMAVWDAFFTIDFNSAQEAAVHLAFDESAPIGPRRTAVAALSVVLSTQEIAPLLEVLVSHPDRALAEDAANILWTYHRSPAIATAASESPHESVQKIARRLLHPETGSPAAGGSRPGAPDASRDIYQEMLKGYERPQK